jgi:hypothetical protein
MTHLLRLSFADEPVVATLVLADDREKALNGHSLTGQRHGRAVVTGVHQRSRRDGIYWRLRCDCGEVFYARTDHILNASERFACRTCLPRGRSNPVRCCSFCGSSRHTVRECPKRPQVAPGKFGCQWCAGQPHRRDPEGCVCGGAYEPLPPITVEQELERPRYDSRKDVA